MTDLSNDQSCPQFCGKLSGTYYLLRAVSAEANVFRQYEIFVTKDLFGQWMLMTRYGRIRGQGRTKCYSFDATEPLQAKINQLLHKRQTAAKRIGCDYVLLTYKGR